MLFIRHHLTKAHPISQLKNKPHPRWMAEQASSGSEGQSSPPSSGGPSTPNVPAWAFPSSSSPRYRPPGFPPPFHAQAPSRSPSYENELESLLAAYAGLTDHMYIRRGGHCGCLNEAACYTTVLELSLRLRKAADVLARSPSHSNNSTCALSAQIAELDMLVKFVAGVHNLRVIELTYRAGTRCLTFLVVPIRGAPA